MNARLLIVLGALACARDADIPPAPAGTPASRPAARLRLTDLGPAGDAWKGLTVMAPDGVNVRASGDAVEITRGDPSGFQLLIARGKIDLPARKQGLAANDVNKLARFTVDNERALVYESTVVGRSQWHFAGDVRAGDDDFHCDDVKGPTYRQDDVVAMWTACQSLAVVPKPPSEAP